MYRPGGFGMMPPVVKNLLILNALVFLATFVMPGLMDFLALYYPGSVNFKPYQIVTHMFTHGGFFHFFFNMFALWMFGTVIEHTWGSKRLLLYYFLCGLGAAAMHMGVMWYEVSSLEGLISQRDYSFIINESKVVGASGAIYGLLAAYGFLFPNNMLMLLFPPIPIRAKYFVLILIAIDLFAGLSNRPGDNVAHFAHLGGALMGLIMLLIWRAQGTLYKRR